MILANMWFINVYYPMINSYTIVWVYHWNNKFITERKRVYHGSPDLPSSGSLAEWLPSPSNWLQLFGAHTHTLTTNFIYIYTYNMRPPFDS